MNNPFSQSSVVMSLAVAALCVGSSTIAVADQGEGADALPRQQQPSIKQYDPRLPPVLPGEEVVTEQGQRMRVWSSAGPVPVQPQPTPQSLQGLGGVIVDGRVAPSTGFPGGAPRGFEQAPPLRQGGRRP